LEIKIPIFFFKKKDPSVDAFKAGALTILQRILLLATDANMEIRKRGMEPDGGGEIYFSCEPVKYTKALQVRLRFISYISTIYF